MRTILLATAVTICESAAQAGDYILTLHETGQREYYCTMRVTLENQSDAPLTEISGFFYSYIDGEQVGRSKGTWFMNVPAGETAEAVFETPNSPCDQATRHDFVVGACRITGPGFDDTSVCANRLEGTGTIAIPAQGS
ncbi:MAG: hypothetical protein AAFO72_12960 [Pseudomonadota bacterium]